jgi:uncharacterized protein YecT (DUF1311 family)
VIRLSQRSASAGQPRARPAVARPAALGVLLGCTLPLAGAGAWAASFDCTKAATRVEKLICADAALSQLDSALAQRYQSVRRLADDPEAVLAAQRAWLRQRDRCRDSDCLANAYRERIAALGGNTDAALPGGGAASDALGPSRLERTDKQVRITQQGPGFNIDAAYPRLGSGQAAAAGERALAAVVNAEIEDFRNAYRSLLADGGDQGPAWELGIDYDQLYVAPRFWAIGLSSYSYTGGAHGGVQHLPVVIDRTSGKPVPPDGLFRRGSAWLEPLSDYCYRALSGREPFTSGDEWLQQGTAPKADNYRKLLPLADGLQVIFEQYQVGPYAIGFHAVTVPYAELSTLLAAGLFPNGRP